MLQPRSEDVVRFEADDDPLVLVIVDTEEEFDWAGEFSSANMSVESIKHQQRAQRILERHGVIPTYLVDYPVASQEDGYKPLREFLADGKCAVGAHLHPWVNPPFDEDLSRANSYPGNLPKRLEREKLRRLTAAIEENFHLGPTIYKAGHRDGDPRIRHRCGDGVLCLAWGLSSMGFVLRAQAGRVQSCASTMIRSIEPLDQSQGTGYPLKQMTTLFRLGASVCR